MEHRFWTAVASAALAISCGASRVSSPPNLAATPHPSEPAAATAQSSAQSSGAVSQDRSVEGAGEQAHQLVISIVSCWLGGVWSDAQGVPEEVRVADADRRCREVIARLYGSDDKATYERVRALDRSEVATLRDKIAATARADSVNETRIPQLLAVFDGVAAVEKESLTARRAGDRVKKDISGQREPAKLDQDEVDAVAPLEESKALLGLLSLDAGVLTHEARALAILAATDRMEIARGLPKHLKIYVLERPFGALFSVPAPEVPRDARMPLKGGAWLDYISTVAENAGHSVPAEAKSLTDRELLAWGGTLAGLADALKVEAEGISDATELKTIVTAVAQRLDNEYRNSLNAIRLAPEPAGPPRHLGHPSR